MNNILCFYGIVDIHTLQSLHFLLLYIYRHYAPTHRSRYNWWSSALSIQSIRIHHQYYSLFLSYKKYISYLHPLYCFIITFWAYLINLKLIRYAGKNNYFWIVLRITHASVLSIFSSDCWTSQQQSVVLVAGQVKQLLKNRTNAYVSLSGC